MKQAIDFLIKLHSFLCTNRPYDRKYHNFVSKMLSIIPY